MTRPSLLTPLITGFLRVMTRQKGSSPCLRYFAALADEAGMTLIPLAIAFATRHPVVTSAIIGPRTMGISSPTWPLTASTGTGTV